MLPRLVVATVLLVGLSTSLHAQNINPRHLQPNRQQQQQQLNRQQQQAAVQLPEIQGTVEGVTRGRIAVLASDNQPWHVAVPANAKVQVTGGATADYLQPGLLVEFKAEIDDRGAIKEKVGELTIVTLSPDRQPGLFPAEAAGEPGGFAEGAERGGKSGKPAKRTKTAAGKGAVAAGAYRIVGKLTAGRGGKLSVQAGRGTLALELTEQPTVSIDVNDYTIASKGDKITVKGIGRPGMAQATEVKIELAEPLSGAKKKGSSAKSEPKRSPKRPKKDEGLPEPPADK
jgi:hypothetical protein